MTDALVIGRRRKGRQIPAAVKAVREQLEAAGWTVRSEVVTRKRALRRHARRAVKAHRDAVVVVGGDGAVLQVVNALAGTDVALGIVPKGTGNLLAGNLDVPKPLDDAVALLIKLETRTIDVGQLSIDGADRDFAVACGIGFDAVVMDATKQRQKRRWGKLAYVANAVREGAQVQEAEHEITIDGQTITTTAAQIFIANFGQMGSMLGPRRRVEPDDGQFDVFVVKATDPVDGLLAGWQALRQKALGRSSDGRVFRGQATEVSVTSTPPQLVETDGRVIGTTPVKVRIRPAALRVIAPSKT
jgi:YegS/Rv2252/BmrU family lipid kinase